MVDRRPLTCDEMAC